MPDAIDFVIISSVNITSFLPKPRTAGQQATHEFDVDLSEFL